MRLVANRLGCADIILRIAIAPNDAVLTSVGAIHRFGRFHENLGDANPDLASSLTIPLTLIAAPALDNAY